MQSSLGAILKKKRGKKTRAAIWCARAVFAMEISSVDCMHVPFAFSGIRMSVEVATPGPFNNEENKNVRLSCVLIVLRYHCAGASIGASQGEYSASREYEWAFATWYWSAARFFF